MNMYTVLILEFLWLGFLQQIALKQIKQDDTNPTPKKPRNDALIAQVFFETLFQIFMKIQFYNSIEWNIPKYGACALFVEA